MKKVLEKELLLVYNENALRGKKRLKVINKKNISNIWGTIKIHQGGSKKWLKPLILWRERERERERAYSRKISFICCAQNTVIAGIEIIEFNKIYNRKKDRLCSNIKVVM